MTARVVRMLNGEDVIADVKEVRKEEDGPAFAYRLTQPYTISIQQPPEVLFEADEHAAPVDFDSLEVEFTVWVPFSAEEHIFVPLPSVQFIYKPMNSLVEKYNQLLNHGKDPNFEDGTVTILDRKDDGTGRGTVIAD